MTFLYLIYLLAAVAVLDLIFELFFGIAYLIYVCIKLLILSYRDRIFGGPEYKDN